MEAEAGCVPATFMYPKYYKKYPYALAHKISFLCFILAILTQNFERKKKIYPFFNSLPFSVDAAI